MPKTNQVNWQPISQMPLIASMITASLNDTREHLGTLSKAKDRPHVLDDATLNRVEQVHTEQMDHVEIYAQQIGRWRNERPSAAQARELDRMDNQNRQLRDTHNIACNTLTYFFARKGLPPRSGRVAPDRRSTRNPSHRSRAPARCGCVSTAVWIRAYSAAGAFWTERSGLSR